MFFKKVYTLVFIRNDNQILLGFKKRGFGVNKWNGFGGKVEQNETIVEAAVRELREESCVNVKTSDLKNIGHLEFTFEGDPMLMDVRVFSTNNYEGTPAETDEMSPKWFNYEHVPFSDMWPDDKLWFPYMLKNKAFYAKFHYQGNDTILDYKIQELDSMEAFYANQNSP
ncbi:oxidized purine nucleoside triphosphate hydrolase-like [Achroia grisella]|uniref:oxidized purine nucleoside triphosphate hydrolase-like n=1 Tax=Achroia grisella TaxID=688607 RepID=UPI0027D253C0|nr:oxidized purine nucleoside triphosphate hydrolase-like [Achroia grisella]